MLHRLLTGLLTGSAKGESKHVRLLKEANEELRHEIGKLADRLEELHSEHRKLRGRFYAARGELSPEEPQSREARKALALRQLGFVPGRAPPHTG